MTSARSGARLGEAQTQTETPATETKGKGARLGDVYTPKDRSDLPEYIKAEELAAVVPFTIYAGQETKGRYGDKISFQVAFKSDEGVQKKVLSLSENAERKELLYLVRRHNGLTNCRVVKLHLSGGATYWKIIDAAADLPAEAVTSGVPAPEISDDDIPF